MNGDTLPSPLDLSTEKNIGNCIYNIRGLQVMLDSDVATFFDVEVKRLNEQMKRNIDRFPEDFCFQLNDDEWRLVLRSQNATSNSVSSKRRYNPYVYTEQGIMALSGVIKNEFAIRMSIKIVRVFISMRKFILENGDTLLELAKLQNRQINFEMETNKKFDEVIKLIDKKDLPKQTIFYDGQYFDAYEFICGIIRKAKSNIILIDPYLDNRALTFLKNRNKDVDIFIFSSNAKSKLTAAEISIYESQYGLLNISNLETIHDRFIITDKNECYSLGASLNYAGKRTFGINKIEDNGLIESILNKVGM
mgnify:CR=1 FL=1